MPNSVRLTPGRIAALVTLGTVALVVAVSGGSVFSPGALNAHPRERVELGGVTSHAQLGGKCSACHPPPWSGQTMADRCLECHADVRQQIDSRRSLHGRFANSAQCRTCHTEHKGERAALTDLSTFDHNCTAYQLTGKHAAVDCKSCHVNNTFKGTSQTCLVCHAEPKAHMGKFGTDCAKCHSTGNWRAASFPGTATGPGSAFDHDLTAFKLTGKHKVTDCKSCHVNNTFKGTPTSCLSCHVEPKVHVGKYGTDCTKCHTTAKWTGATFKHTFPINHGNRSRGNSSCATCHAAADNFKTYTCYGCHEHTPAKMERKHAGKKIVNLDNCVKCHKGGRGRERAGADGEATELCQGCPSEGGVLSALDCGRGLGCPHEDGFFSGRESLTLPDWLREEVGNFARSGNIPVQFLTAPMEPVANRVVGTHLLPATGEWGRGKGEQPLGREDLNLWEQPRPRVLGFGLRGFQLLDDPPLRFGDSQGNSMGFVFLQRSGW